MIQFFRNQTQNRITITTELSPLPLVHCYPGHLNQVFSNILLNAIEAIKNEGAITITTKPGEPSDLMNEPHVCIEIKDNGIGIQPEFINKIFDPFFTTKDIGQGQGLGLSIAYGIIKRHNGKIFVESEPGKGTRISILIPVNYGASR
jgi:signal transduction histidine kinase